MNFRQFLRNYFTFNRRERNGLLILLLIISGLAVFLFLQERLLALPDYDFSGFNRLAGSLHPHEVKTVPAQKDSSEKDNPLPSPAQAAGEHSIFKKQELFYFNPNGLSVEDWMRLGLSKAQAQSVKNYESKGGKFEKKEDLKKIFVISAAFYSRVEDHIVIPQPQSAQPSAVYTQPAPEKKKSGSQVVELNAADTSDLVTLPGIGSVFARRIIAYRNRLGGYNQPEQLLEVFGFDPDRFEQVRAFVKADAAWISKMNINSADVNELKKHPYITPSVATAIVSFRKAHGPYKNLESLQRVDLVNADLYRKIAPYLTL